MSKKYVVRFTFREKEVILLPVRAENPEAISEKIFACYKENRWIAFPAKDGIKKIDCTGVNLDKVQFFQIELASKSVLEKYDDQDFINW